MGSYIVLGLMIIGVAIGVIIFKRESDKKREEEAAIAMRERQIKQRENQRYNKYG